MWLAHKPVYIMTPIGCGEPDLVQSSILRGPGSLVINGLGYFLKKEPTNITPKFFFFFNCSLLKQNNYNRHVCAIYNFCFYDGLIINKVL